MGVWREKGGGRCEEGLLWEEFRFGVYWFEGVYLVLVVNFGRTATSERGEEQSKEQETMIEG